jgi:hypothetical protein
MPRSVGAIPARHRDVLSEFLIDWTSQMNRRRKHTKLGKDKRRKYHHYEAKIFYKDGEAFARRYTDRKRARAFAERQKKSPLVRRTRVAEIV